MKRHFCRSGELVRSGRLQNQEPEFLGRSKVGPVEFVTLRADLPHAGHASSKCVVRRVSGDHEVKAAYWPFPVVRGSQDVVNCALPQRNSVVAYWISLL